MLGLTVAVTAQLEKQMTNDVTGPCACVGSPGDCPCVRLQKGLPLELQEVQISESLWNLLAEDEKKTVNDIKYRALARWLNK